MVKDNAYDALVKDRKYIRTRISRLHTKVVNGVAEFTNFQRELHLN